MKKEDVIGKKLKVNYDGKHFFYTVKEVLELNDNYILFFDKFNKKKYINWKNIIQVLE
jgi:hypothetical protein